MLSLRNAAVLLACAVAGLSLGWAVRAILPGTGAGAAMAQEAGPPAALVKKPPPAALAEEFTVAGQRRGRVRIGGTEVLVTRFAYRGVDAASRARAAAARINAALEDGAGGDDFRAMQRDGEWLVVAREHVIISPHPQEARTESLAPGDLAERWAANIALAMHDALGTRPGEGLPVPPLRAEARRLTVAGAEVGVLEVNGEEVLRLTTVAGRLGPFRRAQTVAERLRYVAAAGARPRDIRAGEIAGSAAVLAGDALLITVDAEEARRAGHSPQELARDWAERLARALTTYYASLAAPPVAPPVHWRPTEPHEEKWAPLVSALDGTRLGVARVSGPRSRLRLVQAVARVETHWKDYLETDIYVPISTRVPGRTLTRVDGCAVTGLGEGES